MKIIVFTFFMFLHKLSVFLLNHMGLLCLKLKPCPICFAWFSADSQGITEN